MISTHYEILGVSETAPQAEIKRVYWRFARKCHPDRNPTKADVEKFKEITAAYFVIGEPERRRKYDDDLRKSRKAGASSASNSASAAPPPPFHGFTSSGAQGGTAPPSPRSASAPSPQGAYRFLFFLRGVLVGGAAIGVLAGLVVIFYASCRVTPAKPSANPIQPRPAAEERRDEMASASPVTPEPTRVAPVASEPTPVILATPEPSLAVIEPTPVIPQPTSPDSTSIVSEETPSGPERSPAESPFHFCGKWRGSFEWRNTMVPFAMQLEQHGNEISGVWTEGHDRVIWRATIHGWINGSTVTFLKRYVSVPAGARYVGIDGSATFVSSEPSPEFLRGTWESTEGRGFWQAIWESRLVDRSSDQPRRESWHPRREPATLDRSENGRWRGWYEIPETNSVRDRWRGWFIPERNPSRDTPGRRRPKRHPASEAN